jgi:hypothetical protein
MTSGQMIKILETGQQQGATVESTQRALGSGIIAAALNPAANFDNMPAILKLLGLPPFELRVAAKATIEVVDGVTYVTVTSDGRTAEDFIRNWEKNYRPSDYAKDVTRRAKFTPTIGVTYRIPIIMGSEFSDNDRSTSKIRKEATRRNYRTLPFEAACLLREAVSDEDLERLGLWWLIGMHDPVKDSGRPYLLGVDRFGDGRWVSAFNVHPGRGWLRGRGFAFLAPQDQS